jgi:hypothetical protein
MDDNTLLKVLEQLLHKIKANRRRDIIFRWGARTGGMESWWLIFCCSTAWMQMLSRVKQQTDSGAENQESRISEQYFSVKVKCCIHALLKLHMIPSVMRLLMQLY